jgi:lipoate-protein ligase A
MITKLIWSPWHDPAINLALEEGYLETAEAVGLRLLLYVDEPCVVFGRNQNPWVESAGLLPEFRRISGGGAVVHGPGCLCWSFVGPRGRFGLPEALDFTAAACARSGVACEADARGALHAGGRKVSGSARAYRGGSMLVHGTLLVEADGEVIDAALRSRVEPEWSKALGSTRAAVAGLADFVPGLTVERLAEAFRAESAARGGASVLEPPTEESDLVGRVARHRSRDWVYGRTPPFALRAGSLSYRVEEGLVVAIEAEPGVVVPPRAFAALGRPFECASPAVRGDPARLSA